MSVLFPALVAAFSLFAAAALAFRSRPILELTPDTVPVWRDPATAATLLIAILTISFCFLIDFSSMPAATEILVTDWLFLFCGGTATLLILRVSCNVRLEISVQKGWQRIGAACFLWWSGDALLAFYDFTTGPAHTTSLADAVYLPSYLFFLWGVLSFPAVFRTRSEARRFWVDALLVVVGAGLVLWYLLPISLPNDESSWIRRIVSAYLIGDALLLFAVAITILRRVDDRLRWPLLLLAAGLSCTILSDLQSLVFARALGGFWERIALSSWLFLAASAQTQWRLSLRNQTRVIPPLPSVHIVAPFLLVIAAQMILFGALWKQTEKSLAVLVLGIVFMSVLILVRQMSTVRENMMLLLEQTARSGEARFVSLIQNSSDVILVINSEMILMYTTPSMERMLGYDAKKALGTRLTEMVRVEDHGKITALISLAIGQSAPAQTEVLCKRQDGSKVYMEIVATNLLDDPNVHGLVLNLRNIHERKILEEQLIHQAFHDPLTNLANRALFSDRLEHSMTGLRRNPHNFAVFLLDLDHFKSINDAFGHAIGDAVLTQVALRLMRNVREGDTVARLGGDEFAILLEEIGDVDEACYIADRILSSLRVPVVIEERQLVITTSIGIALGGRGNQDATELLRNADVAMYVAKEKGRGRYVVFDRNMHAKVQADIDRLELATHLRKAVETSSFILNYQPIIHLRDGHIAGVEALVRWPHPSRGILAPNEFIPLAEETGLILALGNWVLLEACRVATTWKQKEKPYVSINVSTRQLQDEQFLSHVDAAINDGFLEPDRLVLEITETSLMSDHGNMLRQMKNLKSLGLRLAIDDFGTGYSSLSYLQNLPVDLIKIDKSFISNSPINLVAGIVELGRTMGFEMIAEGVETAEQAQALRELGCNFAQGYHFAPPLNTQELQNVLNGHALDFSRIT
jgi:diguanylate cyclase (GGDEF)-like protein/PAS domain S-box-containing protein